MTLEEFTEMWSVNTRNIILCHSKYHDDMVGDLFDVDEGIIKLEDFIMSEDYVIGAIIPKFSQRKISFFIQKEWAEAKVDYFFIGDTYLIVWIRKE